MKKLVLLFAVTILTSVMSFAQMTEGHISYDIDVSSDEAGMEMAVMMFNGSTLDLYFGGDKARTDMDMGSMMSMTTIMDNNSGEILMLMGGMMGNKAVKTSSEELEADNEEEEPEIDIELTNEKKEIAGYKCKKAIIKDADGNEMEYWYTEDIKTTTTDAKSAAAKLPGQALEYSMNNQGLVMSFTATKVETSLSAADKKEKFNMEIPAGYDEMTFEEFTSMGGGM
jgi:GLPGLI family protein